jgi:class 3 adenylate cyclase
MLLPLGMILVTSDVFARHSVEAVCMGTTDVGPVLTAKGAHWSAFAIHAVLQLLGWFALRFLISKDCKTPIADGAIMIFHLYCVIVATVFCVGYNHLKDEGEYKADLMMTVLAVVRFWLIYHTTHTALTQQVAHIDEWAQRGSFLPPKFWACCCKCVREEDQYLVGNFIKSIGGDIIVGLFLILIMFTVSKTMPAPFIVELCLLPVYALFLVFSYFMSLQRQKEELLAAKDHCRLCNDMKVEHQRVLQQIFRELPQKTVHHFIAGSQSQAMALIERFEHTSILFLKLDGVQNWNRNLSTVDAVNLFNRLIVDLDECVTNQSKTGSNVEKIRVDFGKYMLATGLPEPDPEHHATKIAAVAIAFRGVVERFCADVGTTLKAMIGIASGEVVAGVLGGDRYQYDLIGDPANVAARMMSLCEPGNIQVTPETYELLKEDYVLRLRGQIEVKGKGTMTTYYLEGAKDEAAVDTTKAAIMRGKAVNAAVEFEQADFMLDRKLYGVTTAILGLSFTGSDQEEARAAAQAAQAAQPKRESELLEGVGNRALMKSEGGQEAQATETFSRIAFEPGRSVLSLLGHDADRMTQQVACFLYSSCRQNMLTLLRCTRAPLTNTLPLQYIP